MINVATLNDQDLEQLQNATYRERLSRLERVTQREYAQSCDASPTRAVAPAMTLAGESCGQAAAAAPRRSFAPPRSIGWAIKQLQNGARVTRAGWNGRGQWLALQVPDGGSFMTLPYVYIRTVQGDRVPWLASQTDLLACDWQLAT